MLLNFLVLRLGRCLDSLYSALSVMKHPDLAVRITMTISKISNAIFLLADHFVWLGRAGVMRVNLDKWTSVSNRYWLFTIIMNLARDLCEIIQILENRKMYRLEKIRNFSKNIVLNKCQSLLAVIEHKDVFLDTVKNSCDLFIPLNALGYTKLTPGTIGLLGSISSIIGLYCLVNPMLKLPAS